MKKIIHRRLELMIEKLEGENIDVFADPKLGDYPILYEDVFLKGEFLGHLNGEPIGFRDILKPNTRVLPSEINENMKFSALVAIIFAKSKFIKKVDYKSFLSGLVEQELIKVVAKYADPPVNTQDIKVGDKISKYVSAEPQIENMRRLINRRFQKILFMKVRKSELDETLAKATKDIVNRMLR